MVARAQSARAMRQLRHRRVRQRVAGDGARPRLNVFRSLRQVSAQIIDDSQGRTLAAASSLEPALRQQLAGQSRLEAARQVGVLIAQRAKVQGLTRVVFDRGGYRYHGRIKAVAEAAREGGLEF